MTNILESPLIARLVLLYAWSFLSAWWVYSFVRHKAAGAPRLAWALPVVVGNLCAALLLDHHKEPLLITPVGGIFSLAAFKVLALCLNRGPLLLPLQPLQFLCVLNLPIIPAEVFATSGGTRLKATKKGAQLVKDYFSQMGVACVVCWILSFPGIPVYIRHWLYTLCSCSFLAAVFDLLGAVAEAGLGLQIAPSFNKPWLSSSFADFWARRWNLTTTYMMRVLVYEPVLQGSLVLSPTLAHPQQADAPEPSGATKERKLHARTAVSVNEGPLRPEVRCRPSKLRRYLALQVTFIFSGLWHILVFWYNTRVFSWRWCLFFTLQAPILMLERVLGAWATQRRLQLPHWLRVFLANFLLIVVANPLFFGPADDTGFAGRNLEVGQKGIHAVWEIIMKRGWQWS